jgi:hypothetical protein
MASFGKQIEFLRSNLQSDTCVQVMLIIVIVFLIANDFCDFFQNSTVNTFKVISGLISIVIIFYVIRNATIQNMRLNQKIRIEKKQAKKTANKNL